jgi:hypothetical protein
MLPCEPFRLDGRPALEQHDGTPRSPVLWDVQTADVSWLPSPTETNRPVNPDPPVKQRAREFFSEIPGSEGNPYGCFRTLFVRLRNGEFSAGAEIDVNPCGKGGKRKTPRAVTLGVWALTSSTAGFEAGQIAPRQGVGLAPWRLTVSQARKPEHQITTSGRKPADLGLALSLFRGQVFCAISTRDRGHALHSPSDRPNSRPARRLAARNCCVAARSKGR